MSMQVKPGAMRPRALPPPQTRLVKPGVLSNNHLIEQEAEASLKAPYSFTLVATYAFYGTHNHFKALLTKNGAEFSNRDAVAFASQQPTNYTLIPFVKHINAYGLVTVRSLPGARFFSEYVATLTPQNAITQEQYCHSLVETTGLLCFYHYLQAQIQVKGLQDARVQSRMEIFKGILTFLGQHENSDNLKNELGVYLDAQDLPRGVFSKEFKDLCLALKDLTLEKLKLFYTEFRNSVYFGIINEEM